MHQSISELDQRLLKLERENWWLKRVGMGVMVVFGSLLILATGLVRSRNVVQVERLEILDDSGDRLSLLLNDQGQPNLIMRDHLGREQIHLGVASDETANLDFRTRGRLRMSLNSDSQGASNVDLYSTDHVPAARLFSIPDQNSGLRLSNWTDAYTMAFSAKGRPSLTYARPDEPPIEVVQLPHPDETTALVNDAVACGFKTLAVPPETSGRVLPAEPVGRKGGPNLIPLLLPIGG